MEAKVSTINSTRLSPTSFSEIETAELRRKIQEMTELCKQLQDHVEYLENKMKCSGAEMSGSENEEKRHKTSHASEVAMLKEKLKELFAMNMNWQKHNALQEKKLQEQNEKIARLERELASRSAGQLPESQQIEFDQLLLAKKHLCSSLEDEKGRIEEENHQLKRRVESLQTQQEGLTKSLNDVQERCQLLEAQLVMYQEDFKTERSDRERAQSRIVELEMQVDDLKQQVPRQPHLESSRTSRFDPHNSFSTRSPYQVVHQPHEELRGRGFNLYQTDGPDDVRHLSLNKHQQGQYDRGGRDFQVDGRDESDGCQVIVAEDLPNHRNATDDVLSCPNCRRVFVRNQHLELLEHMDECN